MADEVFLNGSMVERSAARVSAFDAGLQHAVGLFETMLVRQGRVFRGIQHLERLAESARLLGLSDSLRVAPLLQAIEWVVQRRGLDAARVRLTVTGGDLNLLRAGEPQRRDPTLLIDAQPPTPYPPALFENGVLATVTAGLANPFDPAAGHKTLAYWSRLRALQLAAASGAGESLCFTTTNVLVGGCVSNVFLVRDDLLLTPLCRGEEPPAQGDHPVLPGVTRMAVLELAAEAGVRHEKRVLTVDDLLSAQECFLTNSSWGVLPVRQIEAHPVGTGQPGGVTRHLRAAWLTMVERETANPGA
jgi:branched-subunit amino acid aminotransferase/4-amino-4-deoxychorismate lyase